MKRIVLFLLLFCGVASAQPVPPTWRPPVTCATNDFLKWNGTTWGCSGGAGVSGTGTSGTIPKFTGTSTIGDSALLTSTSLIRQAKESTVAGFDVGDDTNVTTNSQNGVRFTAYSDGNNYIDYKTFSSGSTITRIGSGAQTGSNTTYSTIAHATGATTFALAVTAGAAFNVNGSATIGDNSADNHAINGRVTGTTSGFADGIAWTLSGSAAAYSMNGGTFSNTGTIDATAAGRTSIAINANSTTTRSAGANAVANYGIVAQASGAQTNIGLYGAASTGTAYALYTETGDVRLNATSGQTVAVGNVSVFGNTTLGDSSSDVIDIDGDLTKFGSSQGDGGIFVNANAIGAGYAQNVTYDLSFNYSGYQNGASQFRNAVFYDGKNVPACTLTGSTKTLNCVGGLQVNGVSVTTSSSVSGTTNTLAMFTGTNAVGNSPLVYNGTQTLTWTKADGGSHANRPIAAITNSTTTGSFDHRAELQFNQYDSANVSRQVAMVAEGKNLGILTAGYTDIQGPAINGNFGTANGTIRATDTLTTAAGVGGGVVFQGAYTGTTTTSGGFIKAMKTNGTGGDFSFDMAFGTRVNGSGDVTEHLRIKDSGAIQLGDTGTSAVDNNVDVVTIGNTGTSQTTSSANLQINNTGTWTTAGGNVTTYGINVSNTSTESAGANTLSTVGGRFYAANGDLSYAILGYGYGTGTNYGGYFDATNGSANYALWTQQGGVVLNGGNGTTGIGTGPDPTLQLYVIGTTELNTAYFLHSTTSSTTTRAAAVANNSTTYNTTAGALSSFGLQALVNSSRASGANNLANYGVYSDVSGAQFNYAFYAVNGDSVFSDNVVVGNAATDRLTVIGETQLQPQSAANLGLKIATAFTGATSTFNSEYITSSATYNTTAGALFHTGLYIEIASTRSAGANVLENRGLTIDTTGGQNNIGIYSIRGDNHFNTTSGTSTFYGNTTVGDTTSDAHTFNGSITHTDDAIAYAVTSTPSAATASTTTVDILRNGTFNTTAGALTSAGLNAQVTTTRSSGANNLTNRAAYLSASGAQVNYALFTDSGDVVLNSTNGVTYFGGASGPLIETGTGTPEAAITAPVGSLFMRTNGGAGTSLYVKESGSGNTGWVTLSSAGTISGTSGTSTRFTGTNTVGNGAFSDDGTNVTLAGNITANGNTTIGNASSDTLAITAKITTPQHPYNGTAPTLSGCGTSPSIVGNDHVGIVTYGSTGTTNSCTVTFSATWAVAPVCLVGSNQASITDAWLIKGAPSTTAFIIGNGPNTAPPGSSKVAYICTGYN